MSCFSEAHISQTRNQLLTCHLNSNCDLPAATTAKSLQSCPTLCDPRDGSPPGSPVPGILWARTLEWVAISFSNAWKWKVKVKSLSCVRLLATPWTAAYQTPLSMGFSRQEYYSGGAIAFSMEHTRHSFIGTWTKPLPISTFTYCHSINLILSILPHSHHNTLVNVSVNIFLWCCD